MTLTVAEDGSTLKIEPKGSEPLTLKVGEWSPWVVFTFPFNSVVKMTGIGRFHLSAISPEIKLYLSPIHFNPSDLPPSIKITAPGGLAKKLASRYGAYKTMGWQIDTWSMSEETIDEGTFLEDVAQTIVPFRKMMNDFLDEKEVGLFVQIYEFPDRVGHCFWRFLDPQHPAYDAEKAARWAPFMEKTYEQMDGLVGDAMKKLAPEDVLIVLSDHGFATWRRSVNYNTWLVENGFMVLSGNDGKQADLEALFGQGEFWPNVDWSKTRAYAMGLGDIYVNLKGREGKGIVAPGAEYEAVREEIRKKLATLVDPKTGQRAVSRVFTREEAYGSFDADVIPDLFVTNTAGYRIGWQGSLGVVTKEMFEDNAQVWSGDHCSLDPALVPGILFANRPACRPARPRGSPTCPPRSSTRSAFPRAKSSTGSRCSEAASRRPAPRRGARAPARRGAGAARAAGARRGRLLAGGPGAPRRVARRRGEEARARGAPAAARGAQEPVRGVEEARGRPQGTARDGRARPPDPDGRAARPRPAQGGGRARGGARGHGPRRGAPGGGRAPERPRDAHGGALPPRPARVPAAARGGGLGGVVPERPALPDAPRAAGRVAPRAPRGGGRDARRARGGARRDGSASSRTSWPRAGRRRSRSRRPGRARRCSSRACTRRRASRRSRSPR